MNYNTKSKSGFTIIEVVLVLAIAGLIFLIVFLAVPALQRSQRDTQRKQDAGRVISAVQDWKSNHRGAIPTAAEMTGTFETQLAAGSSFADPSGGPYNFVTAYTGTNNNISNGELLYATGRVCDAANAFTATGAGPRNVAIQMKLESGDTYCQSN